MKSSLSFLQDDLSISPLDDDRVRVTVVLPSVYVSQFVHLVDSLSGFVQALNRQSKFEQRQAERDSQEFKEQAKHVKAEYHKLIAKLFDKYTAQGLNRAESIKRIGTDLRAMKHCLLLAVLVSLVEGKHDRLSSWIRNIMKNENILSGADSIKLIAYSPILRAG